MSFPTRIFLFIALLGLGSCGLAPAQYLEHHAKPQAGTSFDSCLAAQYYERAHSEAYVDCNWIDTEDFVTKSKMALKGHEVLPRNPHDYGILPADMSDLVAARKRLMAALEHGGRTDSERACHCAKAQRYYDGWVEQSSDNVWGVGGSAVGGPGGPTQPGRVSAEEAAFYEAIISCEITAEKEMMAVKKTPASDFTIYFGLGTADLSRKARAVINQVARVVQDMAPASLSVIGYADRSGGEAKNTDLSRQRAQAVEAALKARGVSRISKRWRGENDNAAPTADGVAEALNRRVVITIRK